LVNSQSSERGEILYRSTAYRADEHNNSGDFATPSQASLRSRKHRTTSARLE
jgi:hypothetical protein